MFLSTQLTQPESNAFAQFASLTSKSSLFKTPTIHSSQTRNFLYIDGTNFGRIRSSQLRSDSSGGAPQHRERVERSVRPLTAQNWRKNLSVNVKEDVLEQGLRDYLGISQPFRPKTSDLKENSNYAPQRTMTASSNKRMVPLGISSVKSVKSGKSFNRIPSNLDIEGLLRRDLMCQTEDVDVEDFGDDKTQHKFLHVKFIKAPSKEFLKLLKLSNYDVTLVPSDSRRVILEAIMRDYFLNLIPETSDFLICKNTQNQVYTIVFTGRLVPTCKACSSVARFEISKDLGFQVLCNSQYCNIKNLYQSRLSDKALECLWPATSRPDVEHSLPIRHIPNPTLSKLIQSGKYKTTDFSRVISDVQRPGSQEVNKRPNTTANIMRNVSSASRINRVVIRTNFNEKSMPVLGSRPNTVQGLRRPTVLRPGTAGSASGSLDIKDFKGVSVLKEFDDEGLFARDKEEIGMIEHVSEEMSADEDERQVIEELKISKETIRKSSLIKTKKEVGKKKRVNKIEEGYMIKPVSKRNFFGNNNDNSGKLDNSMEDIHNMVNILSK